MSGEEGFEFIEVHGDIDEVQGVPGLVQKLSRAIHQVLDADVLILVGDSESGIGAAGIAMDKNHTPMLVARMRQCADLLEHEYLARFN